ncbi:hypothetical protein B0H16DRAFT_1475852 [Mycena metata]|uniref:Uncharacterized protein n=1 Tax=Mycena metata TaxID=1033252 RepID=A0AAD7HDP4_9AGAR|nr:hypothetical protein B0H16DRAFT_1475852 [Mycena metata]
MQVPPERAIFSGYSMSYEYFQKLVVALSPDFAALLQRRPLGLPYIIYICQYDNWRNRLSEEDSKKVPLLKRRCFARKAPKHVLHQQLPTLKRRGGSQDLELFFPTRWIPADDDSSKEDYPAMAQETNVDKSRRDELIALIRERNDFSVDEARLEFDSIEYKHPYHDPLVRAPGRRPSITGQENALFSSWSTLNLSTEVVSGPVEAQMRIRGPRHLPWPSRQQQCASVPRRCFAFPFTFTARASLSRRYGRVSAHEIEDGLDGLTPLGGLIPVLHRQRLCPVDLARIDHAAPRQLLCVLGAADASPRDGASTSGEGTIINSYNSWPSFTGGRELIEASWFRRRPTPQLSTDELSHLSWTMRLCDAFVGIVRMATEALAAHANFFCGGSSEFKNHGVSPSVVPYLEAHLNELVPVTVMNGSSVSVCTVAGLIVRGTTDRNVMGDTNAKRSEESVSVDFEASLQATARLPCSGGEQGGNCRGVAIEHRGARRTGYKIASNPRQIETIVLIEIAAAVQRFGIRRAR